MKYAISLQDRMNKVYGYDDLGPEYKELRWKFQMSLCELDPRRKYSNSAKYIVPCSKIPLEPKKTDIKLFDMQMLSCMKNITGEMLEWYYNS